MLEQKQPDGSVRTIAYISRTTVDSGGTWTPLDLEAGSVVGAIKGLRGFFWGVKFLNFSDHKALESIGKSWGPQRARPAVARVSHRVRLRIHSRTARAAPTDMPMFCPV